ncbi:hypothetical protein [Phytomonospora endophytica]|uniref:Uncharacterized protein n=1 Tax=Phytomonospora endophytica TaxID=714109 RepID=A0A841FGW8_9ACTN|nr:hypothetical protein [Phytomonospora endophytica]MBB6032802.1 hypothetical protein [Phytomonospora endophytica]GIG66049.1 hypothetical protein Pen01_23440 [Phytomonospora endophytica]
MKIVNRIADRLLARVAPATTAAAAPCLTCTMRCVNGLVNKCCTDRCLGKTKCTPRREQC